MFTASLDSAVARAFEFLAQASWVDKLIIDLGFDPSHLTIDKVSTG